MPMKGLRILSKAISAVSESETAFMNSAALSVFSSVVIISQEASAAIAAVPSLSSAMPTPMPTANRTAILSMRALPAFTRNIPSSGTNPVTSPPCMDVGHRR